jgi:hypothetical protein
LSQINNSVPAADFSYSGARNPFIKPMYSAPVKNFKNSTFEKYAELKEIELTENYLTSIGKTVENSAFVIAEIPVHITHFWNQLDESFILTVFIF